MLGIIGVAALSGLIYVIYSISWRLVKRYKSRVKKDVISSPASKFLQSAVAQLSPLPKPKPLKSTTFSIYLGNVDPSNRDILNRTELTILDPFRANVIDAVNVEKGRHYLARLHLATLAAQAVEKDEALQRVIQAVRKVCVGSPFQGVILAGWEDVFSSAYVKALASFIETAGLLFYLETGPPDFLPDTDLLSSPAISGLIVRNVVIHSNGEHRDYFDMEKMQPTVRAWVRESCLRDFQVLALELLEPSAKPSNAVIKRAIQWCGFYSVVACIVSTAGLGNAEANRPLVQPLGAFDWLKDQTVMKFHAIWRKNANIAYGMALPAPSAWSELARIISETSSFLRSVEQGKGRQEEGHVNSGSVSKISHAVSARSTLFYPDSDHESKFLGCFPAGVNATPVAFAEVLQSQIRLRDLGLLNLMDKTGCKNLGSTIRKFVDEHLSFQLADDQEMVSTVKELATLTRTGLIRVYLGLQPGFSYGQHTRFWAVYNSSSDGIEVFASKDAQDLTGTIMHTFLSCRGYSRARCFEIESALAQWTSQSVTGPTLPPRVIQDVTNLTPEERMLLLQQLTALDMQSDVYIKLRESVHAQLIDAPTKSQIDLLDSVDYVAGRIRSGSLVSARLAWYDELGVSHPDLDHAVRFFESVEKTMLHLMRERQDDMLARLNTALNNILTTGTMDAWADILGLATFCAGRKAALDEVYIEVTDRNPLFNDQSDQAAVFAESFALGSRCESYFDVSPSVFGRLLAERFRAHYSQKTLPLWNNGAPDFATVYGGAGMDVDPQNKVKALPQFARFTFLSIFAIPALVDIILLSSVGRGLYLSAFMSLDQQQAATVALMASLLLSGATGTWIACGGSFYLISMAFSAMNVFVLTRLIAGVAFTIAGALIGLIVVIGVQGLVPAVCFFLYLIAFTTYLILFAALASFQYPGSAFLSGRSAIMLCLPGLLVSPVITAFSGHDVIVYLAIFYIVIGGLLVSLRNIGAKWVTWYQNIKKTDDKEIRKWYIQEKTGGNSKVLDSLTIPAALKVAREALLVDVLMEVNRGMFKKPTQDKLVRELAADWDATNFLLNWYCRHADVPRPIPFSSSWNIQTKVGIQTLSDAQKGIRLHSAFIHWRQAGDEVGCGILYFIIALMDKWVEMVTGVRLVGLSASLNSQFRMAVGFGLAYYLIGAVLIDIRAQDLHGRVTEDSPKTIRSPKELREEHKAAIRARRRMYRTTLFRYLMWHVWTLALTTGLFFIFNTSIDGMIMFVIYVFAYTGLLWYQYTKIFSGPHALKPLLIAVGIGFATGVALKKTMPTFVYGSVLSLGVSTWTAAVLCLWTAKIGMPKKPDFTLDYGETFHAFTKPWNDPDYSQAELKSMYEGLKDIPAAERCVVTPGRHPASEVKKVLQSYRANGMFRKAITDPTELVHRCLMLWDNGNIEMILAPFSRFATGVRGISCRTQEKTVLVIGVGPGTENGLDIRGNCQIMAEFLLHEVAETEFGMLCDHAILAEQLVNDQLPRNLRVLLEEETSEEQILTWAKKQILKQHCLGLPCDEHWDKLPSAAREMFLQRCLGESRMITEHEYHSISSALNMPPYESLGVHIARCDLAIAIVTEAAEYAQVRSGSRPAPIYALAVKDFNRLRGCWQAFKRPFSYLYHELGFFIKFFVIALVADPEMHRELDFVMKDSNVLVRKIVITTLTAVWIYGKIFQDTMLAFFIFHGRPSVQKLWDDAKGMSVTLRRGRIVVESLDGVFTAFKRADGHGRFKLYQYKGIHKTEPVNDNSSLRVVSTYSDDMELLLKEEYEKGECVNTYEYTYSARVKRNIFGSQKVRMPESRHCIRGPKYLESVTYNDKGFVESGSYMQSGNLTAFKLQYRKNAKFLDELLRGEFMMAHTHCTVDWCAAPRRHAEKIQRWIPHSKVTRATFVQGSNVYESKWTYDHKFHPIVSTTLTGEPSETPDMITHDWLGILKKPRYPSFQQENPLFSFNSSSSNPLSRAMGFAKKRIPISTSLARSRLWSDWKSAKDLDGVIVRWLDEKILRKDAVLMPYWKYRNRGDLCRAKHYLSARADAIMASADLDNEISSWTPLAIKIGDMYTFGTGGDSILQTRSKEVGHDKDDTLHVMTLDNGTWPNEGGGVSACRRDLVNNLKSIKWHMVAESAHDFGLPKHQTEQNVLSLKVIPLWGLDLLTPIHGLFKNRLHQEASALHQKTTDLDITREFLPALKALVKGARTLDLTSADIKRATRALVQLNDYFADKRHWGEVWNSDVAKETWRNLWLADDMPNAKPPSEWFETELPTLGHFDTALDLWFRYLFIFSIKVPDKVPAVFQASHHSVSAAYGVVCKIKRNCQLQIWDHAVAWRETNMCLSALLCKLPPFVRNSLLGLVRLTSVIILSHADVILPCADFFNPGWEVEIGSLQGTIEHRNGFKRKVAPVVNGIPDVDVFKPVKEIETKHPTVTMLSHLWFCKDLKTAILSADVIVNQWGFKDYQLDIYGSTEKAPQYSNECNELLASKGLGSNVKLCGTANPMNVLKQTWVFLNSSVSEGLPLALGEAALTGAPVVCTDVGASMRVLSDPENMECYSGVVAPNDAVALARAQIKMLAMLDEFGKFADDDGPSPTLPFAPTPQDVEMITKRMYDKTEQRRKLGMMSRDIVAKSFSGERYLREHEQMLWIGKSKRVMEARILGEVSEDPQAIARVIQRNVPWEDEVIPSSDVASIFRMSVRPASMFIHSVYSRSTSRLSHMTSNSRLSQATTEHDDGGRVTPMKLEDGRGSQTSLNRRIPTPSITPEPHGNGRRTSTMSMAMGGTNVGRRSTSSSMLLEDGTLGIDNGSSSTSKNVPLRAKGPLSSAGSSTVAASQFQLSTRRSSMKSSHRPSPLSNFLQPSTVGDRTSLAQYSMISGLPSPNATSPPATQTNNFCG